MTKTIERRCGLCRNFLVDPAANPDLIKDIKPKITDEISHLRALAVQGLEAVNGVRSQFCIKGCDPEIGFAGQSINSSKTCDTGKFSQFRFRK